MEHKVNIRNKILFPILSIIFILLSIFSVFIIFRVVSVTKKNVESESLNLLKLNAFQIECFIKEHSRIPVTYFKNSFFLIFFLIPK